MEFSDIVRSRHSVRHFEPGISISDDELTAIFSEVVLSPSSFNIQHWRFVVVRDGARKQALRKLAFGQAQVEQCAAAILICGRLDSHHDAGRIYGDESAEMRDKYVPMIEGVYRDQPQLQREEAIRSGAMAAMSLMYAAKNRGWDTGPMIGFDAVKVAEMLELDEQSVPVMLLVLGQAAGARQPARGYRRPLSEVVCLESMRGSRLGS